MSTAIGVPASLAAKGPKQVPPAARAATQSQPAPSSVGSKSMPMMKQLPRGSSTKTAERAFADYAAQTGQTYGVDSSWYKPGRPVAKIAAGEPDVPTRFTYLTPEQCHDLGLPARMGGPNHEIGRVYNHYQWCGWQNFHAVHLVPDGLGNMVVGGVVDFRLTLIGWGSKSASDVLVRAYADDVNVPPGSDLNPSNTSLIIKPQCNFQAADGASCTPPATAPIKTIAEMQGAVNGLLEFKVGVNLPPSNPQNLDQKTFFNLSLSIAAASTAEIGDVDDFFTVAPPLRCDAAPQNRGGFNSPACIFGGVTSAWNLNTNDPTVKEVALHIQGAQLLPDKTIPPRDVPKIIPSKLTRSTDDSLNKAQRDRATYQCRKWIKPVPSDDSCDEYPFASTYEGSFNEPENDYSVEAVDASQNSSEGAQRGNWYIDDRILEGDQFYVVVYTS